VLFLERTELKRHFYLKGAETLVGSSRLHRIDWEVPKFEIGYWCRTRCSGQGYTTEAVRSIAAFAFEALEAKRVEIRCDTLNRPSARVAERAGFHL
jgi:RimJ/RimL family protein N-acetyltransferase